MYTVMYLLWIIFWIVVLFWIGYYILDILILIKEAKRRRSLSETLNLIYKVKNMKYEIDDDVDEDKDQVKGWQNLSQEEKAHLVIGKLNELRDKQRRRGNSIELRSKLYSESTLSPWEHAWIDKLEKEEQDKISKLGDDINFEEIKT